MGAHYKPLERATPESASKGKVDGLIEIMEEEKKNEYSVRVAVQWLERFYYRPAIANPTVIVKNAGDEENITTINSGICRHA